MEIITTGIAHLPEIISTVILVVGGQKGFDFYKKKRYLNGGHNRRSNSGRNNSFSQSDKEFIESCFTTHSKESALTMKNSRLELVADIGTIIRDEGKDTREAIRLLR